MDAGRACRSRIGAGDVPELSRRSYGDGKEQRSRSDDGKLRHMSHDDRMDGRDVRSRRRNGVVLELPQRADSDGQVGQSHSHDAGVRGLSPDDGMDAGRACRSRIGAGNVPELSRRSYGHGKEQRSHFVEQSV